MDSSDSTVLISRLEREADERPGLYSAKLGCIAALGYAPPVLLAVGFIGALYFLVASLIAQGYPSFAALFCFVCFGWSGFAVVRALARPFDAPIDPEVSREDAPALFALIESLSQKLGAAPLASVTINERYDLAIAQSPERGVFGGYRNHVQLGLPLLAALSAQEIAALLAHEMSHLRRDHRRFGGWCYRQRSMWNALRQRFDEPEGLLDQMLAIFYAWYIPYFAAWSFVLAVKHEYLADRDAAQATNAQVLGRGLIKLELMGRFLAESFWERLFAQVERTPDPPYRPYSIMERAFKLAEKEWSRPERLSQALTPYSQTGGDTHPCLAERLGAMDVKPALPDYGAQPAALSLLGPMAAHLLNQCDEDWLTEHAAVWRKRHEELKEARWKISEYERCEDADLSPEDLWAKANLLLEVNRTAEGLQALAVLTTRGEYPQAHMLLGQLLLQRADERGLEYLANAALFDPGLITTAGTIGYTYLVDRGRKPEAMRFWQRINPPAAATA